MSEIWDIATDDVLSSSSNLRTVKTSAPASPIYGDSALEIKICVRTYRMFFVAGTADFMWRPYSKTEIESSDRAFKKRVAACEKWTEKFDKDTTVVEQER